MAQNNSNKQELKQKKLYSIKITGTAPIIMHATTWAYNEQEALENAERRTSLNLRERPDINLGMFKYKKISVSDVSSNIIEIEKNY
jgi:hypothetical protein